MGKVETPKTLKKPGAPIEIADLSEVELIDRMDDLRQKRKPLDAESARLKKEYDELVEEVFKRLDATNSTGAKTKKASVSINETEVPVVKDIEAFVKWVSRTKNVHLFTASCISAPSWREICQLNPRHTPPPGTEVFTRRTLNHTSLKGT